MLSEKLQPPPSGITLAQASTLFAFLLVLTAAYALALPGYWLFDDSVNLDGLSRIDDAQSFLDFVTSGGSGPLGRPISLASFAFQAAAWPNDVPAFLRVNIAIQILNTFLVFLLALGLAGFRKSKSAIPPFWIGFFAAVLWGASPFLANTSFMIIQRMTSLSAMFVFAGLAAFVWAHRAPAGQIYYKWGLFAIFLASVPLALLSKENGALLPLLAMITLVLWIPKDFRQKNSSSRLFYLFSLLIPTIIIVGYIAHQVPQILSSGYGPSRYFSPEERLLSQAPILWDYVRHLLIPSATSATPFVDNWPTPPHFWNPPTVGISILAWLGLIALAAALRKREPWLAFGVGFFLSAHLLESNIFGLELYFAHRNYVPAFGVYFALAWAVASVPERHIKKSLAVASTYGLLTTLILLQTTYTWNDTYYNAILWQKERPHSERAVQFLAQEYLSMGLPQEARRVMDEFSAHNPELARTQIMRTEFCMGQEQRFHLLLDEVTGKLQASRLDNYAAMELVNASLDEELRSAYCSSRDIHALARMAEALLNNPAYREHPFTRSALDFVLEVERDEIRKD